jgi:hypothetical protein
MTDHWVMNAFLFADLVGNRIAELGKKPEMVPSVAGFVESLAKGIKA